MSRREKPEYLRVSLSDEERRVMLNELTLSEDLKGQLSSDGSLAEVWVSIDEAEDIREQLSDLLQTRGFDADYSPTDLGRTAEGLIDRFFTG